MSITEDGISAEKRGRVLLKVRGWNIQQIDWIGEKNGKWVVFEIKHRELFNPPPFLGTGLDKSQIFLRGQLLSAFNLHTMLIVFRKNTDEVYCQYLDVLEKGTHFDTKNKIRIYPIENFTKIKAK
ncbi:MAG: hypothetical protein Q8Q33_03525 [Chlamydiota bacterium]|nr:hypothetical protein [Chlamydiota bacterium]